MGLLQKLLKGNDEKVEFKERFKQAQMDDRIANMVEERKKSSNRRELERYMKEKEEAKVKEVLDKIHHKQNQDMWKSNTILKKDKSILTDDRPILKEKNIFLKEKNLFLDNRNDIPFTSQRGMFFK
jgi:hypothetical protein